MVRAKTNIADGHSPVMLFLVILAACDDLDDHHHDDNADDQVGGCKLDGRQAYEEKIIIHLVDRLPP